MEQKWIDTHAHYNHGRFKGKGKVFMDKAFESTEFIINVGTNMKSNQETLQMVSAYDNVYGILGFFPVDVWELEPGAHKDAEKNWSVFKKQLAKDKPETMALLFANLYRITNEVRSIFANICLISSNNIFALSINISGKLKICHNFLPQFNQFLT